jgi:DNA-directed RNA polymerase subunit RPC12/RpoP
MASADPKDKSRVCPACGGRLLVMVRLKATEARAASAYFKCERCAHILIAED